MEILERLKQAKALSSDSSSLSPAMQDSITLAKLVEEGI